jgi:hypothetical protein
MTVGADAAGRLAGLAALTVLAALVLLASDAWTHMLSSETRNRA